MMDPGGQPTDPPLPMATVHRPHRSRIPLVWIVPFVAALIGAWLAVHAIRDHGPTISIAFLDAEGIEAGKTKLRYKSVDVGLVKMITLNPDRGTVEVQVDTAKFAAPFLVASTRFWVVRPRLGTSGVSGLGTLLSGAYIEMDVGDSKESAHDFIGLEVPPVVSGGARGKEFVLSSPDVGSLAVSSPVYFHHVPVGQVSSTLLNPDGRGVTVRVFVHAPYDRFVTADTRFWHASGVDVEVDSAGLHVQSQSLATIVAGGVAFESPPDSTLTEPSNELTRYALARNRLEAMKADDRETEPYVLYFAGSLRGLEPGAVVDFRGVDIGEVVAVNVEYDSAKKEFRFPVLINIYPGRMRSRYAGEGARPESKSHALMSQLIEHGFRAQLRTSSLLTGQLYVALDFFPKSARVVPAPQLSPMPLPTVPGSLEQIQTSIESVVQKLDKLPLEKIGRDLDAALESANRVLVRSDGLVGNMDNEVLPELKTTLTQARQVLSQTEQSLTPDSSLQADVHAALSSVARAADSIRVLADYLDKDPQALIRGKTEDPK